MPLMPSLIKAIEKATGETVQCLQDMPISERRKLVEKKLGTSMKFPSAFPFIGRGNVMGNKVITHADVERQLTKALK